MMENCLQWPVLKRVWSELGADQAPPADATGFALPSMALREPDDVHDEVLRVVLERAAAGSRPGERNDGARVALVCEGGGMAVVPAGMITALEKLGLIPCFDAFWGASAGGINVSFAAAGQARERALLYLLAADRGIVDWRRLLWFQPAFRLEALFEELFVEYPHDFAHPDLRIVASRVNDKSLAVLRDFSVEAMRTAVRAGCAIPGLTGDPVTYDGELLVDGGLLAPFPYREALAENATHVLVLRSRPAHYREPEMWCAKRAWVKWMTRGAPDNVAELLFEWPRRYRASAAELEYGEYAGTVTQLAPPRGARLPSRVECNIARLVDGLTLGARVVYDTFARRRIARRLGHPNRGELESPPGVR